MLRPVRTVRATTKEEVDAALATADQITVEGDDELLSYAVNKVSGDPENRVLIEIAHEALTPIPIHLVELLEAYHKRDDAVRLAEEHPEDDALREAAGQAVDAVASLEADRRARPPTVFRGAIQDRRNADERRAAGAREAAREADEAARRGQRVRYLVLAPVGLLVLGLGGLLVVALTRSNGGSPAPSQPLQSTTPQSDFWANFPSLLWPVVAIVAMFLIVRQAIGGGRNVTIQWKVTEKVSGRVVITKVRERSTKTRAAA